MTPAGADVKRQKVGESNAEGVTAGSCSEYRDIGVQEHEGPAASPRDSESLPAMLAKGAQRYLLTVEYVGTEFSGWQKQKSHRTVQGALEEALRKFVGQPVPVTGSSRTDSGVHATGSTCHVDIMRTSKRKPGQTMVPHPPEVVKRAVNHFLQVDGDRGDVAVVDVTCVPPGFHARHQACERTYHYRLTAGKEAFPSIFERNRAWHVHHDLDIRKIQEACGILVGRHDFSSFRGAGCQGGSPCRRSNGV